MAVKEEQLKLDQEQRATFIQDRQVFQIFNCSPACTTKIFYLLFCMYFETIEWTLQFVKETPQLKWQ